MSDLTRTRDEHLFGPGPKRLLALDGGGIRGLITLGYLEYIEDTLRRRHGDQTLRLCDYFDLIGGTSTGAIIAAGLAVGMTVHEIQAIYQKLANSIFSRPKLDLSRLRQMFNVESMWRSANSLRLGIWLSKFPSEPLAAALRENFGEITLGSEEIRTGLMITAKRFDTDSPWVLHNHPKGRYYSASGQGLANRDFLLRQVVRASTAAPHYFTPERISIATSDTGKRIDGAFVDGGMTPHNNPALQLLMLATLGQYGFRWPLGQDNILLVSLGTGYADTRAATEEVMDMPAAFLAMRSLMSLMDDCSWLGQAILQWLGASPTATEIDSEIGDLQGDTIGGAKLLSYLRYNVQLSSSWLQRYLDLDYDEPRVKGLQQMDNASAVADLMKIGAKAAQVQIQEGHFPGSFDLPKTQPRIAAEPVL